MLNEKKGGVLLNYIGLVVNVIIKFLYTPFLLRALGQSDYGLYSLAVSIVGYLAILDLGFGSAITRYTVKYKREGSRIKLFKLYSTVSLLYIIIGTVAFIICVILSSSASSLFGETMSLDEISKLREMLLLCGINLLFTFPLQISSSVLSAYEAFIYKNLVNLIKYIASPLIMVLLILFIHIGAVGAIWVVTAFNLFGFLAMYLYAWKKLDFKISYKHIDYKLVRPLFNFSLSMFLLMIFEQLQFNSGQFILGMTQGAEMVAVWGIAMVFVLNYRSISTAITNVYMPTFFSIAFDENKEKLRAYSIKMCRLQSFILLFLLSNFIVFGNEFIGLWAGDKYMEAFKASLIIMIPQTIALLLDFSYLIQIAWKRLTYRIITCFIGYLVSFIIVYLFFECIDVISYAYIVAASIFLSQIIAVFFYINRYISNISVREIASNIIRVSLVPIMCIILYFIVGTIFNYHYGCTSNFLMRAFFFNILCLVLLWVFSLNIEERKLILRNPK